LAHGDPDRFRGTYNKSEYLKPRRKMMKEWADLMDTVPTGHGNVLPIPRPTA
jgi:hypothetical protein